MKKKCIIAGWLGLTCLMIWLAAAPAARATTESLTIQEILDTMKRNNRTIQDMTCLFVKTITKNGKAIPETRMRLRYIKEPEVIHLEFINRFPGQKCLYVQGENKGKLKIRPSGFMKFMTLDLDPSGDTAMEESLDPVTAISFNSVIRNFELFYQEALKNPAVKASVQTDVPEDNERYHLLTIQSDSGEYLNMFVHPKTCLPYKIHYKHGSDMATYIYQDVVQNTHIERSDLTI